MHCDISVGNILLYHPNDNSEATGLLIDFDFTMTVQDIVARILTNFGIQVSVNNDKSDSEVIQGDDSLNDEAEATGKKTKNCFWTVSFLTI